MPVVADQVEVTGSGRRLRTSPRVLRLLSLDSLQGLGQRVMCRPNFIFYRKLYSLPSFFTEDHKYKEENILNVHPVLAQRWKS